MPGIFLLRKIAVPSKISGRPQEIVMTVEEYLRSLKRIVIPRYPLPVEWTTASELKCGLCPTARIEQGPVGQQAAGRELVIKGTAEEDEQLVMPPQSLPEGESWVSFGLTGDGRGWLIGSSPEYLFAGFSLLKDECAELDSAALPWIRRPSFPREKSTFDLFLTQYARGIDGLDREAYIREYARLGFTHVEVNGLAAPFPWEQGVEGEFYPDFYTYCPALDQFVFSRLNEGLYPREYLDANRALLKENARLAVKYGLVPGLLCFEPRSVPEAFFQKYPTLRGARVDHPFRSFKPRYTMSTVHPAVRSHYREMLAKLMDEVPELGFLTIWSNDSGAGFEHTKSLYVGRNGGAYMIREWKDDREIARTAAGQVAAFFHLLKEEAVSVNPDFRVITRLESFYGEREFLWPELKTGVDAEVNSLLTEGWESNYPHPSYPEVKVLGSIYHNRIFPEEKKALYELRERGSEAWFFHFFGIHGAHEPLYGIPYPWLTYDKLRSARENAVTHLSHLGGIQPPDRVPFAVNQEVFRLFQFNQDLDIEEAVKSIAAACAGEEQGPSLVEGWRLMEEAVRQVKPLPVYSHYGVVWQRLFVRPLVPDIGGIPEEERAYYEKYMCTSIHNPNRVDLSKDVLFDLISPEYARSVMERMDADVMPALDRAVDLFRRKREETGQAVFADQRVRCIALRCLYETLRNTAAWIYSVHTYLQSSEGAVRKKCRSLLDDLMDREVENTNALLDLWESAGTEWLIVGRWETPFIHGDNFGRLLRRKLALMEKFRDHEPAIDPSYMFRFKGNPYDV
jgi:hypothetical protein